MNKKKALIAKIIIYMVLISGIFFTFAPFAYMVATSLTKDSYAMPYPPVFIPKTFYYQNYIEVWQSNNFGQYFLNSVLLSSATVIISVIISCLTAYGFAKFSFKGKKVIFRLFIFSMMVPNLLNIIPQFTIIQSFHLVDTYKGVILIYIGNALAWNTFFLRSFFVSIPNEFSEAVSIDGGGRWVVFWRIIMPLSMPAIGTFSIFAFCNTWDEFFVALTIIKTESLRTLPIALRLFEGKRASNYGLIFAAALIIVTPMILIFVLFQKYLIRGVSVEGSIK